MKKTIAILMMLLAYQVCGFTALSSADTVDVNPGDGICADSNGQCSLRAAIMEGNADPNHNTVNLVRGMTYQLNRPDQSNLDSDGDLDINESMTLQIINPHLPITQIAEWPTIDANGIDRVLEIDGAAFVTIDGVRITGGDGMAVGQIQGGGVMVHDNVSSFTLKRSIIENNQAIIGAGLSVNAAQNIIEDTDISLNSTVSNGSGVLGVAIYNSHGSLSVKRSSLHHNGRMDGQNQCIGAINIFDSETTVEVKDTSISQNGDDTATGCVHGIIVQNASLSLNNLSILNNYGRGVHFYDDQINGDTYTFRMRNSLLDNSNHNCSGNTGFIDLGDAVNGFNISSDDTCDLLITESNGNFEDANIKIHPGRSDYGQGAFFWYQEMLPGSLGIDNGSGNVNDDECDDSDQRATSRPIDGDDDQVARCDSGAIEYNLDLVFYHGLE